MVSIRLSQYFYVFCNTFKRSIRLSFSYKGYPNSGEKGMWGHLKKIHQRRYGSTEFERVHTLEAFKDLCMGTPAPYEGQRFPDLDQKILKQQRLTDKIVNSGKFEDIEETPVEIETPLVEFRTPKTIKLEKQKVEQISKPLDHPVQNTVFQNKPKPSVLDQLEHLISRNTNTSSNLQTMQEMPFHNNSINQNPYNKTIYGYQCRLCEYTTKVKKTLSGHCNKEHGFWSTKGCIEITDETLYTEKLKISVIKFPKSMPKSNALEEYGGISGYIREDSKKEDTGPSAHRTRTVTGSLPEKRPEDKAEPVGYGCNQCVYVTVNKKRLGNHNAHHHGKWTTNGAIVFDDDASFANAKLKSDKKYPHSAKERIREVRGEVRPKGYQCRTCNHILASKSGIRHHLGSSHQIETDYMESVKLIYDEFEFDQLSYEQEQKQVVKFNSEMEAGYECRICTFVLKSKTAMSSHLSEEHGVTASQGNQMKDLFDENYVKINRGKRVSNAPVEPIFSNDKRISKTPTTEILQLSETANVNDFLMKSLGNILGNSTPNSMEDKMEKDEDPEVEEFDFFQNFQNFGQSNSQNFETSNFESTNFDNNQTEDDFEKMKLALMSTLDKLCANDNTDNTSQVSSNSDPNQEYNPKYGRVLAYKCHLCPYFCIKRKTMGSHQHRFHGSYKTQACIRIYDRKELESMFAKQQGRCQRGLGAALLKPGGPSGVTTPGQNQDFGNEIEDKLETSLDIVKLNESKRPDYPKNRNREILTPPIGYSCRICKHISIEKRSIVDHVKQNHDTTSASRQYNVNMASEDEFVGYREYIKDISSEDDTFDKNLHEQEKRALDLGISGWKCTVTEDCGEVSYSKGAMVIHMKKMHVGKDQRSDPLYDNEVVEAKVMEQKVRYFTNKYNWGDANDQQNEEFRKSLNPKYKHLLTTQAETRGLQIPGVLGFECHLCQRVYPRRDSCLGHYNKKHNCSGVDNLIMIVDPQEYEKKMKNQPMRGGFRGLQTFTEEDENEFHTGTLQISRKVEPLESKPFVCKICDQVLQTKDLVFKHFTTLHPGTDAKGNFVKNDFYGFECNTCSSVFMEKKKIQEHYQIAHGIGNGGVSLYRRVTDAFGLQSRLKEQVKEKRDRDEGANKRKRDDDNVNERKRSKTVDSNGSGSNDGTGLNFDLNILDSLLNQNKRSLTDLGGEQPEEIQKNVLNISDSTLSVQQTDQLQVEVVLKQVQYHQTPIPVKHQCQICSMQFLLFEESLHHLRLMHNIFDPACIKPVSDNPVAAMLNYLHGINVFQSIPFEPNFNIVEHAADGSFYKCRFCEVTLKNAEPQEVISHQLTHSFYYFYKCGLCPQLFQHCDAREHYQQFHTNTAFEVQNLIKLPVPVKLHTEQVDYAIMNPDRRPFDQHYMCRVCPYACAQRGMMKNHQMTHADYYSYKCYMCDHLFKNRDGGSHFRKQHNDQQYDMTKLIKLSRPRKITLGKKYTDANIKEEFQII